MLLRDQMYKKAYWQEPLITRMISCPTRKWTWFSLCIHAAHLVLFREFLNIAGLPKFVPMVEKQNGRRPQSPFKIYGTAALPHMIYAQNTLNISQPVPMQLTDSLLHILQ